MTSRPTVLVTGATGTVGQQVVTQLRREQVDVRALTRRGPVAAPVADEEVVRADLSDPHSLRPALVGVDAVFLVWPFATSDGAEAVLDLIAEHARRVVYLSSAAVRDHERHVEGLLQQSGPAWTVLRPHAFASNTLRWANQIRHEGVVREPFGAAAMPAVHEGDVAAVAVRALIDDGHRGAVYELTGPVALTQAEQAQTIGDVVGRPIRWADVPPDTARLRMLRQGWPAAAVDEVLRIQEELTRTPARATSTVRDVTGAPARSFRSWAADHRHAFRGTMRAARIHEFGAESVVVVDEAPMPAPQPGEVLIEVAATSFNPSEAALRSGALQEVLPVELPYTLGWDVAGTIAQVGDGVHGYGAGDRVVGRLDAGGAAAEYVVAPAAALATAPTTIPLAQAAAVPVAGLTAWQAVLEHANIAAGQRVLINGAGGGVGGFAVQLAKRAGATVVATASSRSAAAVRGHGADHVFDYTTTSVAEVVDPVDAVINLAPVGQDALAELVRAVRPGGVVVSITTPVEPAADEKVTGVRFVARNDVAQLAEIVALIDDGALTVDVAAARPLSELASVHADSEAGKTRGKIILLP